MAGLSASMRAASGSKASSPKDGRRTLRAGKQGAPAEDGMPQPPGVRCRRPDAPEGSRPHLGPLLLLGYYTDDGNLIYAGRVGTGMPDNSDEMPRRYASSSINAFACFRSSMSKPSVNHP